jgi:hypothetical protein
VKITIIAITVTLTFWSLFSFIHGATALALLL